MWKPPKDDGGSPISHYIVEKMDTARGVWAVAGEFADCSAKVNKLIPNHEYQFRIFAVNAQGVSKPLDAGDSIVARNPFGKKVIGRKS
jgi:hypothetical protein